MPNHLDIFYRRPYNQIYLHALVNSELHYYICFYNSKLFYYVLRMQIFINIEINSLDTNTKYQFVKFCCASIYVDAAHYMEQQQASKYLYMGSKLVKGRTCLWELWHSVINTSVVLITEIHNSQTTQSLNSCNASCNAA